MKLARRLLEALRVFPDRGRTAGRPDRLAGIYIHQEDARAYVTDGTVIAYVDLDGALFRPIESGWLTFEQADALLGSSSDPEQELEVGRLLAKIGPPVNYSGALPGRRAEVGVVFDLAILDRLVQAVKYAAKRKSKKAPREAHVRFRVPVDWGMAARNGVFFEAALADGTGAHLLSGVIMPMAYPDPDEKDDDNR